MNSSKRLPPWHEHFRLSNGHELLIRPIRPEDAEPLRAGFSLLGPDEIRQRFLYAGNELSAEMAARLCAPSPQKEFALVAAESLPPGEALVGAVARAAMEPGSNRAEFTVLISRFLAGQGLGRHLIGRLVKWARRRELDQLYGDLLETNHPALQLTQSMGFRIVPEDSLDGLVRIVLDLSKAAPEEPATADQPA